MRARFEEHLTEPVPDTPRLHWNLKTTVEEYRRIGKRNPKWDHLAEATLRLLAQRNARKYSDEDPFAKFVGNASRRAVEAGCDDPLVHYCYVSFHRATEYPPVPGVSTDPCHVALELKQSQYSTIRKFWGCHRAVRYLREGGFSSEFTVGPLVEEEAGYVRELIEDRSLPVQEVFSLTGHYLDIVDKIEGDRMAKWGELEPLWIKHRLDSIDQLLLRGDEYILWAWKARGHGFANTVTEEGWRLFGERLSVAGDALQKAYDRDPSDPRPPTGMVQVTALTDRGEMGKWFERALAADTNNLEACEVLLNFLQPKWGGSADEMLAFGRRCVTANKFGERVVRTLIEAHKILRGPQGQAGEYCKSPVVWEDIQLAYNELLRRNPEKLLYYNEFSDWADCCEKLAESRKLRDRRSEVVERQAAKFAAVNSKR